MEGYKTIIASAVVAALGALQGLDWVAIVTSPQTFGWSVAAVGVGFAVLRALTMTPIFTKSEPVAPAEPPAPAA